MTSKSTNHMQRNKTRNKTTYVIPRTYNSWHLKIKITAYILNFFFKTNLRPVLKTTHKYRKSKKTLISQSKLIGKGNAHSSTRGTNSPTLYLNLCASFSLKTENTRFHKSYSGFASSITVHAIPVVNTIYHTHLNLRTWHGILSWVRGGPVVACWAANQEFKSPPGQKFVLWSLLHLHPMAKSVMMSTLTVHYWREDETVREKNGQPPSYAEAKKMKSLTLNAHGCLRANLRDYTSSICWTESLQRSWNLQPSFFDNYRSFQIMMIIICLVHLRRIFRQKHEKLLLWRKIFYDVSND